MAGLSAPVSGSVMDFDPFTVRTEADPTHEFGALVETNQGRDVYRHTGVGAANISGGKLQQAPAPVANHMNLAVVANQAAGDRVLTVTLAGTAATNRQYDQGKLVINAGTGLGQTLQINHNPAQATTTGALRLALVDSFTTNVTSASSKATLVHNPYSAVVEAAVKTRTAAGVPLVAMAASNFGWLKTKGVTAVLTGSAVTLGSRVTSDGSTAGAVTDDTDVTAPQTEVEVGQATIIAGTTGEYNPIFLSID